MDEPLVVPECEHSLSHKVSVGDRADAASVYCDDRYSQRVMVAVSPTGGGRYVLIAADSYIGLYDAESEAMVGRLEW